MGPLTGIRVIELGGIGPGPFCGMLLADMGADVIRIDRVSGKSIVSVEHDILGRNKRSICVNMKNPAGVEIILKLCETADAAFEGFRPGVAEKLGLGPDQCMARNPKLVYGRMTGWGQDGPLAQSAGHDINYIALAGALHNFRRADECPVHPLNLVGDYGGGGMLLALGLVCAILEASNSGKGQVVDAAMVDGAAQLMAFFYGGIHPSAMYTHFNNVYETKDGKWVSIGSAEPQFYTELFLRLGLNPDDFMPQFDTRKWPEYESRLKEIFKSKTRDEWCGILEGTDVCFAPVLSLNEAPKHPHNLARKTFVEVDGVIQPAPSPRFSRTATSIRHSSNPSGFNSVEILSEIGYSKDEILSLQSQNVIR